MQGKKQKLLADRQTLQTNKRRVRQNFIGDVIAKLFKIFKGLSRVRMMNCLCWLKTRKVLGGTV